ncbi:MAG TPA: hypothetical protein VFK57_09770 [Vicinamibacterales bacterium]|nr:hypothetical protein [Vicinamibacterales bacterium]
MKRLVRMGLVALPLMTLAVPAYAEVKTREKTQVKFEGMLGRMFNLFGGKNAKEGIESRTAVKGNRKASLNDNGGTIVDLTEEKVYELDAKKKQYTVTTFDEIRRRMREAQERARKEAEKESGKDPSERPQEQKPAKEFEVDFDVKDTGQRRQIAGYDARNTIVTITVREKGRKLEESGGMVMTNDMWLGPQIPELKELAEFEMKYWKQLQGPQTAAMSAEQMSAVLAMYPLVAKAMERMQKEGDKLAGTPLDTTMTFEAVLSDEQLAQAKADQQKSGGGGIGGLLAKKLMKKEDPKQRATIFTSIHQLLDISKSVAATDLAVPADYKEKK